MEYALIAIVPSLLLTPRLPAMVRTDTLTMEMSSTSMKVAKATPAVRSASCAPRSGGLRLAFPVRCRHDSTAAPCRRHRLRHRIDGVGTG